jgi:glycosyltransferase involved in cell wall biosynthesis
MVDILRVGLTEAHGMVKEIKDFAPPDVRYSYLNASPPPALIHSPIKGFLRRYEAGPDNDLVEAHLMPVLTRSRWIGSFAAFIQATAFSLCGLPLPRAFRVAYIRHLLLRDNCRQVIFLSEAGRRTLHTYAGLSETDRLLRKVTVVHPAVRRVPDEQLQFRSGPVNFLFSGEFFRKGGVNVIDAFEEARRRHPAITLTLCCDEAIDFRTPNAALRAEYLRKIATLGGITLVGRVPREEFLTRYLPAADVYLMPTYVETFGMAVIEAMAYARPVVATKHFAIPEMITHGVSGLLIDNTAFNVERLFRGYIVDTLPDAFRELMTGQLLHYMCQLIESPELRHRIGAAALQVARSKFSFDTRNERMRAIYRQAVQ